MFLAQHRPAGKLRALGRVSSPLRVIGGAVALSRRPGSPVRVVTPLRSEPASAPGEESTPVSASVLVATGCAWRGRAGGPAKPEARRDTKRGYFVRIGSSLTILKAESDPGLMWHGRRWWRLKAVHASRALSYMLCACHCLSSSHRLRSVLTSLHFAPENTKSPELGACQHSAATGQWTRAAGASGSNPGPAAFATILSSLLASTLEASSCLSLRIPSSGPRVPERHENDMFCTKHRPTYWMSSES